jgi:hypothetical protein
MVSDRFILALPFFVAGLLLGPAHAIAMLMQKS